VATPAIALILFGHGSRDPNWAEPMRRIQAAIEAKANAPTVTLAFLEFMAPDLGIAIADAVKQGATRVRIAPIFLGQGAHVQRDLKALIETARASYPSVEIEVADPMGESESVIAAISDWAADA
jgi:sirohydrochlorin cobaltochelatase